MFGLDGRDFYVCIEVLTTAEHVFSRCYSKYHWLATQRQTNKKHDNGRSNHTINGDAPDFSSKNATCDRQISVEN